MEAIILAGGLGTRLASKLNGLPKAMAPVAGRPFLEILLCQLQRAGCAHVLLSVGHLHHIIEDRFGASFQGMPLDYVIEDVPLGTGGAIRASLSQATEESVLVLNGDTFLQTDYSAMLAFHADQGKAITLAIAHQPDIARYGGVLVREGRIAGFEEKGRSGPGWMNAGAYAIRRNVEWPLSLPEKFSFEVDYLMPEVAALSPAAWQADGFFIDIGIPADLERAQAELAGFQG
jgi:D-glycero-alpha-D-manno-heptose 1-phosphate guanylyltransferase